MTDFYVSSVTGLDTNDGLSWATAKATLAGAIGTAGQAGAMVAGDRLFVSHLHAETVAGASKTHTFPGTPNAPNLVMCVPDGTTGPATTGASVTVTGIGSVTLNGSIVVYGIAFAATTGASSGNINIATAVTGDVVQRYENCSFSIPGTNSTTTIVVGGSGSSNTARSRITLRNCNMRLSAASQRLEVFQYLNWQGGKLFTGATLTHLLRNSAQGRSSPVNFDGVDFSEMPVGTHLLNGPNCAGRVVFRNCRLPVGWTGTLVTGVQDPGLRAVMYNCDSADTTYRLQVSDYFGTHRHDAAVVKSGGSGVAWVLATNAGTVAGYTALESEELFREVTTVGVPVTVSVDVVADSSALTNADAWLDVQYLGTAGVPLGVYTSGRAAPLSAPAVHPASSAVWADGSLTTPQRQRLSVSFTPEEAGYVHVRVALSRPSSTVYFDPSVMVT